MTLSRLLTSWESFGLVLVSTVLIYVVVIAYTRMAGPRSLATMSSFDFAATVAIGSTVATVANLGTPLVHGIAALAVLYGAQAVAAFMRRKRSVATALDNSPLVLMVRGEVLSDHLRTAHLAEAELWSQLRRRGIANPDDVEAVLLETTGDVSVLTEPVDPRLLAGVRGAERVERRARG